MDNGYYPGSGNYNSSPGGPPPGKMRYPHYIDPTAWDVQRKKLRNLGIASGLTMIGYILVGTILVNEIYYIVSSNAMKSVHFSETLSFAFEIIYTIGAVGLPFFVMKKIMGRYYDKPLPFSKPAGGKYFFAILIMGLGVCFAGDVFTSIVSMISDTINQANQDAAALTTANPETLPGIVLYILRTAIVPALIEESAVRGVVMQPLRKYGDMFAVLMSSLVFGLLHCNLAQIPFAFIAGVALGCAVCLTESIWTSIIIHALNNTYALIVALGYDRWGEENSVVLYASSIVFYGVMLAAAIVAFKYFTSDKTPRLRKSLAVNSGRNFICSYVPGSARVSNAKLVCAYLVNPGMIAGFIAVCIETASQMRR